VETIIISSFDEYVSYIEKYKRQYYFRGHANSKWDIEPSIMRANPFPTLSDEQKIIAENASEESDSRSYLRILKSLATLFRLQHYGHKTRICDLTTNSLAALYFATEDTTEEEVDGAVFVVSKKTEVAGK